MAYSLLASHFLYGVAANRPTTSDVPAGTIGFYFATDTGILSMWQGGATGAWTNYKSGGGALAAMAAAITAAGTTQPTATALVASDNIITTAAASTGVSLPASSTTPIGTRVFVSNGGANAVTVYPGTGDSIDGGTVTTGGVTLTNAKKCFYTLATITSGQGNWISGPQGGVSA